MLSFFRPLFRAARPKLRPSLPAGQRVYAVGDIHGRLDLLRVLATAIEEDDAACAAAETTVILLGDLVDRGADSAGVIAFVRAWGLRRRVRMIAGNHEQMFLESLEDTDVMRAFLRHGGRDTVLSYPVDPITYASASFEETQALVRDAVPAEDLALMRGMEDWIAIGDYLFVHAGIRPGVPVQEQRGGDLRWIREPFLSSTADHGMVVIHGHTITDEPVLRANRIGIDTGAFRSGRLTALVLEGETRRFIATRQDNERITTTTRSVQ